MNGSHDTLFYAAVPTGPHWTLDWDTLGRHYPWIKRLRECPQDPEFHAEGDVWIHTRMVCESLAGLPAWRALPEQDRRLVFWAALLHDVAKPDCTVTQSDGRVTARGHSRRGAIAARDLMWRMGVPLAEREHVCGLIAAHQSPFFLIDQADPVRPATAISLRTRCDHLALLAEADALGRVCADQARLLDNIALFRLLCDDLGCLTQPYSFPSDLSRYWYFRRPDRVPDYQVHDETWGPVFVMSGLPAAGKDTWIARNCPDIPVIALDDLRQELGIDPSDGQGRLASIARDRARDLLRVRQAFVWNATNIGPRHRTALVNLFSDYGAFVGIVYVETSAEEQARRNSARLGDRVPDSAMSRMLARWEVPDLTEAPQVTWHLS